MSVLSITIIGVLGTALFAMFWRQFGVLEKGLQRLHDEMHRGFADAKADRDAGFKRVDEDFKALESKFDSKHEGIQIVLREHGERLARIETKLGIPPAEAA